ncbi:MAG: 4Fe-4S binding protein [Ignavibacteriae bacterium]|nr:4Fe-4S binding protein [Ignavibacteriota bacterium]
MSAAQTREERLDKRRKISLTLWRRLVQIATLAFFVGVPLLNLYGVNAITGTLYSVAVGSLTMSDPLVVIQHVLAAKELYVPLLLSVALPVVLAVALGPVFCSWMCPQGFMSELIEFLHQRLMPSRNTHLAVRSGAGWIRVKWGILVGGLIAVALFSLPLFNYISAPGIITTQLASGIFLGTVGIELVVIAAVLVFEFFWIRRGWCKVVCPIGAALIAMKSPLTLRIEHNEQHKCNTSACKVACVTSCQLDIDPRNAKAMWLCTNCAACVDACPDSALLFTLSSTRFAAGRRA